ncbi:hypothetical protein ACS0TY_003471 [Phlomoides rotata]
MTRHITLGLNSSFVTLIPKKPGVPIFRGPARVCHLAPLVDSIISSIFGSFYDGVLLASHSSEEDKDCYAELPLDWGYFSSEHFLYSFLGTGICRHLGRLVDGSRWIVGQSSGISFWNDSWLGYIISKKIGIPQFYALGLTSTISDYFFDGLWHFDHDFFFKHTDIIRDILSIHISRGDDIRVWGSSVSCQMTSRLAYDHLRATYPRVGWSSWIWGSSIPPCCSTLIWRAIWGKLPTPDWLSQFGIHGPTVCFLCHNASESLDHIFAHCSFTRSLLGRVTTLFDLSLYYDIGFLDVF